MGKKVIDSLPDEVLLHIFEMLDGKTLKDCCLTCLRWNTLIGTSSKIMQKFEFELKLHELRWFADITRNIHTIRIQKESMSPTVSRVSKGSVSTELETILEKHGADLRQVKISETDFDDFGHLLKHLPRLERLELNSVVLHKTRNRDPLTLSKLKHLMISDCDDVGDEEILHILKAAPKLTSLQLYDSKNRTKLLSFVLKLQSLESLSIGSSVGFTTSEDINLTTVPFRLKKFAIRTIPGNSVFQTTAVEHEYFKKFLKLHEDSLVDLYLNQYFSIECYQLILSQFKNLQRLDINVSHLPTEKTFYVCLSPLLNVKILKLRGTFANHETGKLFFQNFPSIESLDMKDMETKAWSCKILKTISKEQKSLSHLSLVSFYVGTNENMLFNNLSTLNVVNIYNARLWINFILLHRQLENVSVGNVSSVGKITPEYFKLLVNHPSLRHLKFSGTSEVMKTIFNEIKDDYKNLKSVEFEIQPSVRKIVVHLPADRAFWHPERHEILF